MQNVIKLCNIYQENSKANSTVLHWSSIGHFFTCQFVIFFDTNTGHPGHPGRHVRRRRRRQICLLFFLFDNDTSNIPTRSISTPLSPLTSRPFHLIIFNISLVKEKRQNL